MSLRSRIELGEEPLFLMDGSAFIFRSFYAYQNMTRSDGFPTNALYMVARLVLKLLREEQPAYFAFVMDGKGPTFRHERFPAYKAQRSATPEPLVAQLAPLRQLLDALGLPVLVSEGCEADDCLASLALRFRERQKVVILGADKDLKQCLHPNVILWDPAAKDEKITTLDDFVRETGMQPSSWPDYQALVGDASDNIPGVPKIGPKTALTLIRDFPHLEELFARLPAVPPKIRPKLEGQRENALLYRELTRLSCDACPTVELGGLAVRPPDLAPLLALLDSYELRSLTREVSSMSRAGLFAGSGKDQQPMGQNPPAAGQTPVRQGEISAAKDGRLSAQGLSAPGLSAQGEPSAARPSAASASEAGSEEKSPTRAPSRPALPLEPVRAGGVNAGKTSGPQPVPPAPEAPAAVTPAAPAVQGSLMDTVSAPVFLLAATTAELPFAAPEVLALLPREDGLLLAAEKEERLYTGPLPELARWLAAQRNGGPDSAAGQPGGRLAGQPGGTAVLVTPDCKALGRRYPDLHLFDADAPLGIRAADTPDPWFDLSLAAYLLSPEDRGYAFDQVAGRWADPSGSVYSPVRNPGLLALDLYRFLSAQLAGAGLAPIFTHMELPLAPVLARMEERGIQVDQAAFAAFLDETQRELDRLTATIHHLAGRVFNIRSAQQLSDVLFTVLELPTAGKTRGGAVSTSQETLEKLHGKHPIIEAILEYRKLEKLRSTYLEPLPRLADAAGRLHTTFNQTATATGRLSSSNPNLQNIPIRGPQGLRMRACFIAPPGAALVCADYSQIELRVLAHLSGDPTLLEAFRNNEDIHSRTAGLLFDLPLDQVTADMRRNAKTINFGLIYGMGAQKLAQELSLSLKEAKAFIERYFARLTRLKEFYDAIEEEARTHGYVATMSGRRRLTPDILSQNIQLRSQARRQAINTRIQGSAADIIKLAMLAVEQDPELRGLQARLLLQIHDELLLEAPESAAEAVGRRLAALMASVNPGREPLSVPLLVDWGIGPTWAKAH